MKKKIGKEIISVNNVVKKFGDFEALKGVSAKIFEKEVVVVLGPSGSGKSTFIRTINRLEPHDSGKIIVDGVEINDDVKNLQSVRSNVGMVFQQFNLFPHLSVLRNITLAPQKVKGLTRSESNEIAMSLLERVGIPEQSDKFPSQLSGGQQQRVAIARALAMRPKVMLLDEITSALDPEVVGEVLNVIRSLNKEHNLTMIMVTHQMGFAREISDRVCFFNEGKIFEQGPPEKLFGDPQNERTKQFLHAVLDAN